MGAGGCCFSIVNAMLCVLTGHCWYRVTPLDKLYRGKKKLEQKVIDFEKLDEADLQAGRWDVVFITYVPTTIL
jgi:hypothetical protein